MVCRKKIKENQELKCSYCDDIYHSTKNSFVNLYIQYKSWIGGVIHSRELWIGLGLGGVDIFLINYLFIKGR